MPPSPTAVRLGTVAALFASTSVQAQQSCPLENRIYELSPTGERVNIGEVGQLRDGVFLHLNPIMRELQSCASRAEIQSSAVTIE
ncbi:hypothetical protein K3728_04335 [Rhodobacteraceae bacterium M385]|nr:hypothetical protein K3728_04335 [Rhodobacteraceae bacterium M385]